MVLTACRINRVIQALNFTKIEHFSMIFLTNLAYMLGFGPDNRD